MFSDRLRELRKDKKLTQEALGKIINVTKVSVSGYENGNRTPDTETLQKLADYFEVSVDYILGRTDNPKGHINIAYDGGGLNPEDEDEEEYLKQQLEQYRKMKKRMQERLKKDEQS